VVFDAGLDKARHPEVEAAERPINDAFLACVAALTVSEVPSQELAIAVEATAHGHAMLLLDGSFGSGAEAIELAAERAARAALALVESRRLLRSGYSAKVTPAVLQVWPGRNRPVSRVLFTGLSARRD
jgi:hypothetical protein